MNTHDIELPPLPEARIVSYQIDSVMRREELHTHNDSDLLDYGHACYAKARADLIAERKLRTAVTNDVITQQRKHEWERYYGKGGARPAESYTVPPTYAANTPKE